MKKTYLQEWGILRAKPLKQNLYVNTSSTASVQRLGTVCVEAADMEPSTTGASGFQVIVTPTISRTLGWIWYIQKAERVGVTGISGGMCRWKERNGAGSGKREREEREMVRYSNSH